MSSKKLFFAIAGVLGIVMLLGAFARSASTVQAYAPVNLDVRLAPSVTLDNISIGEDRSVNVDGQVQDPAGGCLAVSISNDGEREAWWPVYRCLDVAGDGSFSLRIPSDDGGSPMNIHLQIEE